MPSYQGNALQDATLVLKIGGKQVTEHLMNLLMNGKYSFPDDNFLLWRKKKKTKFTVSSRKEIIRELKVEIKEIQFSKSPPTPWRHVLQKFNLNLKPCQMSDICMAPRCINTIFGYNIESLHL